MTERELPQSSQQQALRLERLRVAPDEQAWRIEIETILGGYHDIAILHQGDAADYVEDLIDISEDPAASRVAFQDALEHQVARWKPGRRGTTWMLDLLRRFKPAEGLNCLIEMFLTPDAFVGDPAPEDPEFRGRDRRLQAFHALERYFPSVPPYRDNRDPDREKRFESLAAFEGYVSLLEKHLAFPRYRPYVSKILERLKLDWVEELERHFELNVAFPESWAPLQNAEPLVDLEPLVCIAPKPVNHVFELHLASGPQSVNAFRSQVESLGCSLQFDKRPIIERADRPDISPWELQVSPENYPSYFFDVFLKRTLSI